jgi:phospholipase C
MAMVLKTIVAATSPWVRIPGGPLSVLSSSGQEAGVAGSSRDNALDHVVVVVFENRSLDNLLGRLYGPGDGKTFEGVIGKDLPNPIPEWAEHGADRKVAHHPQLRRDPVPQAAPRRPGTRCRDLTSV